MGTLQARSYGNLRRGVLLDEIRRSAMQFKMFGMTVGLLQSQRIVAQSLLRGASEPPPLKWSDSKYGYSQ